MLCSSIWVEARAILSQSMASYQTDPSLWDILESHSWEAEGRFPQRASHQQYQNKSQFPETIELVPPANSEDSGTFGKILKLEEPHHQNKGFREKRTRWTLTLLENQCYDQLQEKELFGRLDPRFGRKKFLIRSLCVCVCANMYVGELV